MVLRRIFFDPVLQKARWEAWRFRRCCKQVARCQRDALNVNLSLNGSSQIGQSLDIPSMRTVEEFRAHVPITRYEDYAEAIERCKQGDSGAMLGSGQHVLMFALSSGTTGQTKFIPLSRKFLNDYRRGWLIWGHYAYGITRLLVDKMMLPITSPSVEFKTSSGIPCGAISGLANENQNWITKRFFAVPKDVYQIKHPATKYYVLGRFAIEKRVGAISSANPSTVLSVFRVVNERRDSLIADVEKGTLDGATHLEAEQRKKLQRFLKPNPRLAKQLRVLVQRHSALYPKHFWKDLALIANWKGGSLNRYLDFYDEFFGDVEVRDIGLIASEGRMTIPMSSQGADGVLDVASQFYEFIPESDIEEKVPRTYLAHELEKGQRYFILLTNSCGFFRYDIRDLVEVTGFFYQAPILRFLNKGKHFSSITGEKLSEYQVVEAVNATARTLGLRLESYSLFPKWGSTPHYGLLVEEGTVGPEKQWPVFLRELEGHLCRLNFEYEAKRVSGRLEGVRFFFVASGTFAKWKESRLHELGGRVEQYKHVFLVPDHDFDKNFVIQSEFSIEKTLGNPVS